MKFELKITSSKDFWAGLMFIVFGLAFWYIAAKNYAMGNAVRMGPAYFPVVLGGILAALGAVIFAQAFVVKSSDPSTPLPFRRWYFVAGLILGVIAFFFRDWRDPSLPDYAVWKEAAQTALLILAAALFFGAFPLRVFPFRLWSLLVGLVLGGLAYWWYTKLPPHDANPAAVIGHAILAGSSILLIFAAFGERSLWVVLFSVVLFGYLLKPLGLVLATFILTIVSAVPGFAWTRKDFQMLPVYIAAGVLLTGLTVYVSPWMQRAVVGTFGAVGLSFPPVLALIIPELILGGVLAYFAGRYRWPHATASEVSVLGFVLAIFAVASFVHGLGLPMNVWPSLWE